MKAIEVLNCVVCNNRMDTVLEFPDLPLTGIYSKSGQDPLFPKHDQALMLCEGCGHGQLRYILDGKFLYDSTYGFRTSTSSTASGGSQYFAQFLSRIFPDKKFARVLEFGCNDVYLLNLIQDRAEKLLGVDPILKGRESEFATSKIQVIGERVESIDFKRVLGGAPDLILSQHTMEHLENPKQVLKGLMEIADENSMFAMEFPCFDPLLVNYRFDQVFHQHLQYFSLQSTLAMLEAVGAELIDFDFNNHYWGALLIAFRKKSGVQAQTLAPVRKPLVFPVKSVQSIRERFEIFKSSMNLTASMLKQTSGLKYGYGAALMLPILGYHMQTDFSELECVLDDDPQKANLGYINLPVKIKTPEAVNFRESTILLTAMDNRRPILRNLLDKKPLRILNPLGLL